MDKDTKKFIEAQFDVLNKRMEASFTAMDNRFDALEASIEILDTRLNLLQQLVYKQGLRSAA